MPCSTDEVSGGQWKGEIPAPENVEIIAYLNAIRPVPSDEQYIPSLEFDVLTLLKNLSCYSDDTVREDFVEIVKILKGVCTQCGTTRRYVQMCLDELGKIIPEQKND